jgi:HEAT repeat protein
VRLGSADWHVKQEDVVGLLGDLKTPAAVDALYEATQWVPAYLDFDENRVLADKAVRALAAIPGEKAEQALLRVLDTPDATVRKQAEKQIARRREAMRTQRGAAR